jgi:hypothetical protein
MLVPGNPPDYTPEETPYYAFLGNIQNDPWGVETDREPLDVRKNYIDEAGFNPLLPEEIVKATWHTNTGISVTRYSYVWSYPGYRDFIIYDYHFVNTGQIVSMATRDVVPDFPAQILSDVYFAFHSGISVSTKSSINIYNDLWAVAAGAFGWETRAYHDHYHIRDNGGLVFSTNWDGGREPTPWGLAAGLNPKEDESWKQYFGDELMSPAAFGWLALYADPTGALPRSTPKPDVLRVDSHKGGQFKNRPLSLEHFRPADKVPMWQFYQCATTPDTQEALGNEGNRLNFYTMSYGPYTLAPGDSVRIVIAEIAGVMDYHEVVAGDPYGHFPDSSIGAIRRNAEFARQAVSWGMGGSSEGYPLAADAPEPPPGPEVTAVNASQGDEQPLIAITWDDRAETATIEDGSGEIFYDGTTDLDGYRIYRSDDFQHSGGAEKAFRGAYWDLVADIPKEDFSLYWDTELGKYAYKDVIDDFGKRFGYYVSAYYVPKRTWTSVNGTQVNNLPELESGDYNRTPPTTAKPGPVETFDIYVAPNPFIWNSAQKSFGTWAGTRYLSDTRVEFRNLPESATIRIYTISGDLIRVLKHGPDQYGNLSGSISWDLQSESGLTVAPGLYIYYVESDEPADTFVGKLMIIR